MNLLKRTAGLLVTAIWLANPVYAQNAGKSAVSEAAAVKALQNAMTPGEGQKKLTPMIGTFNVKIRTWVSPVSQPVESTGTMVSAWVLDGRYVQTMLAGEMGGEPFNGIGYIGYDNVEKIYQTAWMDTGSTGMTWYKGNLDASGKSAIMKATVANPLTAKPTPLELRLTIEADGGHVTEIWGKGLGAKMFRLMELRYTKVK